MANVVRFTLPAARNLNVPGAGFFTAGVLDVDALNPHLVSRTRYLVKPYGAIEVGVVDSATPAPALPFPPGVVASIEDPVLSNFVYDGSGNLTSYKENGTPIVLTYNADGSVATSKRGDNQTKTYSYSGGNLIGVA